MLSGPPLHHPRLEALRKAYGWAFIAADFSAASLFVVGSWLFFYPGETVPAVWAFLVGSCCFALKPAIRLGHYLHEAAVRRTLMLPDIDGEIPLDGAARKDREG